MSSYTSLILGENIASGNKLSNSDINCNKNEQAKILTMYLLSHPYNKNYAIIDLNEMTIHGFTVNINFLLVFALE